MVAHCCSSTSARISEEILGSVREPLADSHRCGQPTSSSGKIDLRSRTRPTVAAVEQPRPQVAAGKLLYLLSILWQIQQISILQQEGDARKKDLRPDLLCPDSRESVILNVDTPMTLPEKRKRRGRDLIQATPKKPLQNLQNPTKQGFFEPVEVFGGVEVLYRFFGRFRKMFGPKKFQIDQKPLQDLYTPKGPLQVQKTLVL